MAHKIYNLIYHSKLYRAHRPPGERPHAPAEVSSAGIGPARIWSGRSALAGLTILASTLFAVIGCGHATVPCPTPTRELDRLREETDRTRDAMDQAIAEERALKARRDAEARRLLVARESLDSLETGERR